MTNFWGEKRKLKQKKLYIKEKIQLVSAQKSNLVLRVKTRNFTVLKNF